jgi:GNAT superfamily N-acetyltransferase
MAVAERADTPAAPDGRLPAGFDGPRACGPYELAPDLDLINLVFRTQAAAGPPRAPSMGWDYSRVYNQHNLENVRIVCHGSRPVASVGIYPTRVQTAHGTIGVGGINAVGTHPEYRRLGLATLTMQDAAARMREIGMHVGLLSTGITNWYRKLGWERAGRQRTFTFDRRNVTSLPAPADLEDLEVTDDWQPHLDELCALRNASGVGAVRTPEVFALLTARKASHVFVARRAGSVAAYVTASGASLREYAGAAEDVLALVRHAFGVLEELPARSTERGGPQQGQFELTVQTPAGAGSGGLADLLLDRGIPSALTYLGMLLILDPPRLFEALRIEATVEHDADGAWRLSHGGASLRVTDGELVKLVFGPERTPGFAPDLFPIDFYQWPTDRV